jgi:RHS repeat-associated protein
MSLTSIEPTTSSTPIAVYLYAGDQIIENVTMGYFYYQDSLGNTSHVTDAAGNLLERYTYSAFGTPAFFDAVGTQLAGSAYGIRHLFNGQLWTQQTGLIDYRNRQALPVMGVFVQPDPLGFAGGDSNLYRYCGNNPINGIDPLGLSTSDGKKYKDGNDGEGTTDSVVVNGNAPDFGGTNNTLGFRDVNSLGGLDNLSQGGGRNSFGGAGGSRLPPLPRLARDSSKKGTVAKAPISTQGYWTNTSGLPTGPTVYILTDAFLRAVLGDTYERVMRAGISEMSFREYALFMSRFDTIFYQDGNKWAYFQYEGQYTSVHGTWLGLQVNYIGVGEGFAARGWPTTQMNNWIDHWNSRPGDTEEIVSGKYPWAAVGYDYFLQQYLSERGH